MIRVDMLFYLPEITMIKKSLALVCALFLTIGLSACGGDDSIPKKNNTAVTTDGTNPAKPVSSSTTGATPAKAPAAATTPATSTTTTTKQ